MENIIILGFGRSGTTWLSDIISKVTGNLILFEPFHPSVTDLSKRYSYSTITEEEDVVVLEEYLKKVLNKKHRKMWLMRNHVPVRLENISQDFLELLWNECEVIGFKEIRANFMIKTLQRMLNARIIFIIRHPLAVVASIKQRTNFWEFGWQDTYNLFLQKTLYSACYKTHRISRCIDIVNNAGADIVKSTVIMWAITHAIVLPELKKLGLPLFFYEEFYRNPFSSARQLFRYLGHESIRIHPSYLFTPSMTTLKTVHGFSDMHKKVDTGDLSFFWEKNLSTKEIDTVMDIVTSFEINIYNRTGITDKSCIL